MKIWVGVTTWRRKGCGYLGIRFMCLDTEVMDGMYIRRVVRRLGFVGSSESRAVSPF